ncbi:hypothetical protein [Pseudoalteromonas sp. SR41-1]|uniref:hypothetical protein n=1 Tax=Pseudoalteromonas sp. SR41-1 TaxID=2760952 RepID=UPI0015FF2197|nr:hypothetical protein [Pseudoalteromonas sp. SR41-1]MBB1279397.1 hypothetical protein [Pseudoalteromonas sp. SR41-1]
MKQKILAGLIIAVCSSSAYASIKDKKAIRAADASIAEEVAKVKASCGNAKLDVNVDWDDFKKMAAANEAKLADDRYQSQWIMSHAGQRTVAVLEAVSEICKDDADYKEELALLTKVTVSAKQDFKDSKSEFSLDDTVLKVKSGHKMTRRASDFTKSIKELY